MTPNDLLLAAGAGDPDAFVELRQRMTRPVRLIVQGYLEDPARVDAVTAAVFDEAWRTAGTFDPAEATANQWILALARRAAQRARRPRRAPSELVVRSIRRDGDLRGNGSAAPREDDRLIWAVGVVGAGETSVVGRRTPDLQPGELVAVGAPDRLRDVMADRLHRLRSTMARLVA